MIKKTLLFKAFWGVNPPEVRKTVIISPVIYPKQFEKMFGEGGTHFKTILSYLVANYQHITYIKTPMTQSAVYDAMALLSKTSCERVVFIGAIGGLQKNMRIGDVVASRKSRDIYSVNSIHEETRDKLEKLRKTGVLGVDFESRSFFKAARKNKLSAQAYYVVTDLPLTKPFYIERTQKEAEMIQKAINKILLTTKT
jgi:purine-nucleoside phosphorylase